jgi:hypothetical protein
MTTKASVKMLYPLNARFDVWQRLRIRLLWGHVIAWQLSLSSDLEVTRIGASASLNDHEQQRDQDTEDLGDNSSDGMVAVLKASVGVLLFGTFISVCYETWITT